MELMPFVDRLEEAGLGLKGRDIFIYMIPADRPSGFLLRNKLSGTQIDYELPGFYQTKFQLIARSTSYPEGEESIKEAIKALTIKETQVGDMFVRYSRPVTKPVAFALSNGNLIEFAVDFDVAFDE